MYRIRDDQTTNLLYVELSGRVATAEAARAVSQAFALAEAGQRTRVLCDLRDVSAGPDEPGVVAAVITALRNPPLRIAFVGSAQQLQHARQLARLSRITGQSGVFSRITDAEAWLVRKAGTSDTAHTAGAPARRPTTHPAAKPPVMVGRGSAA